MSETNEFGFTSGGSYEPLAEGKYDAVLHAIIGLGRQKGSIYKGKQKPPVIKIKFVFELPSSMRELEDGTEIPNVIGKNVNVSDSVAKGGFAAMLKALGGHPTEENITSFMRQEALEKLLGRKVVLDVQHFDTEDGSRPFVASLTPLDPRIPDQPEAHREPLYFNPRKPDLKAFKEVITSYTRDIMMSAYDSDQFPKELHEAYATIKEQEAKEGAENKKKSKDEAETPWEGSTEAIE